MSSDIAISVEGLSKCYLVGHQGKPGEHDTLRDQIVRHARNMARKTADMARGRAIVQGDTVEEFWALKDVSFEIPRGARVGILGRNGAGKSTLLKLLSRITEPTEGRITINGRVASLLEVGTGFHPELSGRENIFLNGAILGMSRREIRAKFDEIVDFAEVERFLDTPVKRYSSGMYVRLAFAVAAHLEPELLIVDEVLAVGDAQFQSKCLGKMRDVGQQGRTVIFVSHNVGAMRQLCDTGIYLSGGTLLAHGDIEGAISYYLGQARHHGGSREWRPEPGAEVSLRAAAVRGRDGAHRLAFDANEPIEVVMSLSVRTPVLRGQIGFTLASVDAGIVFASEDVDSLQGCSVAAEGEVELKLTVPANLLNEGAYMLSFYGHVPKERWLFREEHALSFNVHHTQSALGRRAGVVTPRLVWERARGPNGAVAATV